MLRLLRGDNTPRPASSSPSDPDSWEDRRESHDGATPTLGLARSSGPASILPSHTETAASGRRLPGDPDKCVREHRRETPRAATLDVPARAPWREAWHGDSVYEGGRMGDGGVPHAA